VAAQFQSLPQQRETIRLITNHQYPRHRPANLSVSLAHLPLE
jgi:hypothetical protein